MKTLRSILAHWPIWAGLISLSMLAAAHAFEKFGKLYPCPLCLQQREAYWAAAFISLFAFGASKINRLVFLYKPMCWLLGIAFLAGAGFAIHHSGVELGWFEAGCTATGFDSSQSFDLTQSIVVGKCDERTIMFANISMANLNAVASFGLAVLTFVASFAIAPQKEDNIKE